MQVGIGKLDNFEVELLEILGDQVENLKNGGAIGWLDYSLRGKARQLTGVDLWNEVHDF